jgi:hypothetical protein
MDNVAAPEKVKVITVTVNNRPVEFQTKEVTGAQIKAAAISQGVPIQPDFQLFKKEEGKSLEPIGDGEIVHLHEHEAFRASATDDNSGYSLR